LEPESFVVKLCVPKAQGTLERNRVSLGTCSTPRAESNDDDDDDDDDDKAHDDDDNDNDNGTSQP